MFDIVGNFPNYKGQKKIVAYTSRNIRIKETIKEITQIRQSLRLF